MDVVIWLVACGCCMAISLALIAIIMLVKELTLLPCPSLMFLACVAYALGMYDLGNQLLFLSIVYIAIWSIVKLVYYMRSKD